MNLLFVNNFRGMGVYGIELWMMRNCMELAARGHRTFLACRPGVELSRRAAAEGIERVDYDPTRGWDRRAIRALRTCLLRWKIDAVCVKTYHDMRHARLAAIGLPARLFCRRGNMRDIKNTFRHVANQWLFKPEIIVPSAALKTEFARFRWMDARRIHIQHHGIDIRRYEFDRSVGPADRHDVVFVGRLCHDKAVDVLLQAWRCVLQKKPSSRLALVGGMEQIDYLRMAQELGVAHAVSFVGYRQDVRPWLWASDMLVLPSRREGAGLVVLEAMAAGIPVVASSLPCIEEYVVDRTTGLTLPPGQPDRLADALLELIDHPEPAKKMGLAGRVRASSIFSLTSATVRLEEILLGRE